MELFTQSSGEPSLLPNLTQEDTGGRKKRGAGSLAIQNQTNYLLEEINEIASDVRAVGQMLENKSIELKALQAVLDGNDAKAKELVQGLTFLELNNLHDTLIQFFNLCRAILKEK